MRLTLKILKLFAILILTVSIILFSAAFLLQDKVAVIILKSLNENISTKLDVGTFKLSFIRKFPKASIELKNVLLHSSTKFNSIGFKGINTDTLLSSRFMIIEFKITDIINGVYKIDKVSAKAGKINFLTDKTGLVNYDISIKKATTADSDFTIDLERIYLTDFKVYYHNLATKLIINGQIKTGLLKSRISGDDVDFTAKADMEIDNMHLYNTKITKAVKASLDFNLQSSKSGIIFKKGILNVENYDFGLTGFISSENMLDISITGHNIDIAKIRNYLPEKYLDLSAEYDPSGILTIQSRIKGFLTRISYPHIEINCSLSNGHIAYGKSDLTINNLSFSGFYSNGTKNIPETSSVSFKNIKAKLGTSEYTGEFILNGFDNPIATLLVKGKVLPKELKEFFDLQSISKAEGSIDVDLKFAGILKQKEKYSFSDIIDMNPEGVLVFNSVSIDLRNKKSFLKQISGKLTLSTSVIASDFQLTYLGQRIKVNGEFKNLPGWLDGRPVPLIVSADITFNRFIPEVFLSNSSSDTSIITKNAYTLPDDIFLDINFNIDSLYYKSYSSSKVAGTLNYKPRILTFKTLKMQSLNGMISGTGFVLQNANKSFLARGTFNVSDIDVHNAFTTFHNFGQNFLKAENIAGSLSGSFSLLLPMDSLLSPKIKSISAEGKYILVKGNLINFDPVKELSSFIELSELETISFDRLENDFFIRNNFLYVPQMDVKSSAADLSVNGKHSFDNDYEYHVRILLSEFLSKKRKKNKSNVTEFGVVEDDGLGRTSLLLKIEGKGEVLKVGYDIKAVSNKVKDNIKSERQALKSILNQEYGWFKSDTSQKQKLPEKKSGFKISWEENDSIKSEPEPQVIKKRR
jgi:hypothetical protein